MRGLSLLQPWASLVAIGVKTIETRSWRTDYRGELLICSSKGWDVGQLNACYESLQICDALSDAGLLPAPGATTARLAGRRLPLGYALAIARLSACRPTWNGCLGESSEREAGWVEALPVRERSFGDFSPGRYGWTLDFVTPLPEPIPVKGSLGLWDVPAEVVAEVDRQLGRVAS